MLPSGTFTALCMPAAAPQVLLQRRTGSGIRIPAAALESDDLVPQVPA